jgi:peptidoglycan/LPS O-acetylase OafA/YrhL
MREYILSLGLIAIIALVINFATKRGLSKNYAFDVTRTNMLRGVLALLIILHHLSSHLDIPALYYFHDMGSSVVSMFFFISGYGLIKSYKYKGELYLDGFLTKRLRKILPLYIIFSIFMSIVVIYNTEFGGVFY